MSMASILLFSILALHASDLKLLQGKSLFTNLNPFLEVIRIALKDQKSPFYFKPGADYYYYFLNFQSNMLKITGSG